MGNNELRGRVAPLEMTPEEFRTLGHRLVDQVAQLLAEVPSRPVTPGESPEQVRAVLGKSSLPEQGGAPAEVLDHAWRLLSDHSLFNGHPRFAGYVTSSAAPAGILAELLAAAVNPNCGAWTLSPMASEMESQAIRWIAELIGYPATCGGLLVSGGNMANFVGFLAARRAKAPWDIRSEGAGGGSGKRLFAYVSKETHTWIQKAADLFGLGTESIRWISTGADCRIDTKELRARIEADRADGGHPFLIVGSAGTVSTGAVDPMPELAAVAREYGVWFHVDGAYGAPAAALPDASDDLKGLVEADSIALDPHKWLYTPLEAGCTLVRDPRHLLDAFDYSPVYYRFAADAEEKPVNYYALGPQNSRGFRALKVWTGLRVAGRQGLRRMIAEDIELARLLYRNVEANAELEALTHGLSITTFRYVPTRIDRHDPASAEYLNELNEQLVHRIQKSGEVFLSNAVVQGKFALRLCIVNFRTSQSDIEAIPEIVVRLGRETDAELR